MKTAETLKKNFKLLFRSKEAAFTIIFGPLLIILLVGFAFSGNNNIQVTLGSYSANYTTLADQVIQHLIDKDYKLNIYSTKEECIEAVELGRAHACIIFPEDFEIKENHTNTVEFDVDPSRINIVYAIIDQLSKDFNIQSSAVSRDLTQKLITTLTTTKKTIEDQSRRLDDIKERESRAYNSLKEADGRLQTNDLNFTIMDWKQLRGHSIGMEQDAEVMAEKGIEQLNNAIKLLNNIKNDVEENSSVESIEVAVTNFQEAINDIRELKDNAPERLRAITDMIESAAKQVDNLNKDYTKIKGDSELVNKRIKEAINDLAPIKQALIEVKGNLDYQKEAIDSLKITSVNSIVSPITTTINPITTNNRNITFTYPYILMLVIMMMGLMLGSTLVVMDKTSSAAFRNFTTATRDEFHILMSFITTFLILLIQTTLILLFSIFIVNSPLLNNLGTTIVIILLAITLFSFLGMIIGYLSRRMESAMIAGLTIGSISLFISNLVIPIEGMNILVRAATKINPYVILSELLKKSMLFGTPITEFGGRIITIFILLGILFSITLAVQKYVRKRYFKQQAAVEVKTKKAVRPLEIMGRLVKDEYDLLTTLDLMTRKEFEKIVNETSNPIAEWVVKELDNKKLGKKLKTTSKEKMIIRLDKCLKRMTRKQSKR